MSPVPLVDASDERRFGGKAVGLSEALRHGFVVPPGLALDVALVEAVVRGDRHPRLRSAVGRLGGTVAVRSSAVGEDSGDASFAGQHATRLNAGPHDVHEAVHAVWASGRTEAALAYRARLGIGGAPTVAVVVQKLLAPDCAGVLFTRNPLDGSDQRVIEASWGLGEVVVAGLVTPERLRLAPDGAVLEHDPGDKDLEVIAHPDGGTEEREVEAPRRHAKCLSEARIASLHALATRAAQVYESASDLEWAFEGDQLYVLQRRPVTR